MLPLVDVDVVADDFSSLLYISLARRREAAGTPLKRHLRAAIFYSFGARVRGQPAGRYAISRADRTHSRRAPCSVFH